MKYYMPVIVYDEADCLSTYGADMKSCGKKALIVTGRHSAEKSGALADVCEALKKNGQKYCVFNEVEENPSVETVMKAALYGKKEKADFVIGIGGGSPMDAAKAIAFLMKQKKPSRDTLYDKKYSPDALDVIAVPTTCGTGSEVTGVSVLTVHEKQTKISIPHRIFPKIAYVDGKYLGSASRNMLVNTAVDALAHMVESYESTKANDYSKATVLAGMRIWGKAKDVLLGKKEADAEDYQAMMRASTFAGIAIAQTGTSIPHALSYILTYDAGIPHGRSCGYFLDRYLNEAEDKEELLSAAGFADMKEFSDFISEAFGKVEVSPDVLERAFKTVAANKARMQGCRFHVDEEVLKRIVGF